MPEKKLVWIYALLDHERKVRYVGQSNCVERRYLEHLCDANDEAKSMKRKWLARQLVSHGLPTVTILDVVPRSKANVAETKLQFKHKATVMQGDVKAVVNETRFLRRRACKRAESTGSVRYRRVQYHTVVNMLKKCRYDLNPMEVMGVLNALRRGEDIPPMEAKPRPKRRPRTKSQKPKKSKKREYVNIHRRAQIPESLKSLAERYYSKELP